MLATTILKIPACRLIMDGYPANVDYIPFCVVFPVVFLFTIAKIILKNQMRLLASIHYQQARMKIEVTLALSN